MSLKILIVYFLGCVIIMVIVYNNLPYYPYPDYVSILGNKENTLKFVDAAPKFLAPYPGLLKSCMLFSGETELEPKVENICGRNILSCEIVLGQWGKPRCSLPVFLFTFAATLQGGFINVLVYFACSRLAQVSIPPVYALNRGYFNLFMNFNV